MVFWAEVEESDTRGGEQFHGPNNPCPWLILSSDKVHRKLPIALAIPLSSKTGKPPQSYRVLVEASEFNRFAVLPGQTALPVEPSLALTEQLRILAHERLLGDPVATVDSGALDRIEAALKFTLDIE